ncbi:MAG TPA: ABC transporter permease [Gemmatimonadaceae bacterium]|jgi:predicted permease
MAGERPGVSAAGISRRIERKTALQHLDGWLDRREQDIRHAVRSLRRAPGFAAATALTLALGIGVSCAMFSVVYGVLLRPLPYSQPEQLVTPSYHSDASTSARNASMVDRDFVALSRGGARSLFTHVATWTTNNSILRGRGDPTRIRSAQVTSDFFGTLGTPAEIGRAFAAGDDYAELTAAVVLSDRLWRTRFNADRSVLGAWIDLDGTQRRVIGIMSHDIDLPAGTDVWTLFEPQLRDGQTWARPVIARLAPGVTLAAATARWKIIAPNLTRGQSDARERYVASMVPLTAFVVGDATESLVVFAGAVLLVLLIACANASNLMLMRLTDREREFAVRAALGADRTRLVGQVLTESSVISILAALIGTLIAYAGVRLLFVIAPPDILPRMGDIHVDATALWFTIALIGVTTVVCGVLPLLQVGEHGMRPSLAQGSASPTAARGSIRSLLVAAEVALALSLLVGTGLMVRSFRNMQHVDLGFSLSGVVTASIQLPEYTYRDAAVMKAYHERVLDGLSRIPGVESVGAINLQPFRNLHITGPFVVEDRPDAQFLDDVETSIVTPDYFRAAGMTLLAGRHFTAADRLSAMPVVILSKSAARFVSPSGSAIGKRIARGTDREKPDWLTVVGVVNDIMPSSVTDAPSASMYRPLAQTDFAFFLSFAGYVASTHAPLTSIAPAFQRVIHEADPTIPIPPVMQMGDVVHASIIAPEFQSRLLAVFSSFALVLAISGIYSVLAYSVTQRRREIGVRIALGASPMLVRAMVLRATLRMLVPGLAVGIAATLALTRVLGRFLFQIQPTDPPTFVATTALLVAVALLAAYVPAKRATELDPLSVLRSD